MAFAITDHALIAVFAGAEEHDFIFESFEHDGFEARASVAVIAEWLLLAESASTPVNGLALAKGYGGCHGARHFG